MTSFGIVLFSELEPGDVFTLRWWLDEGPTLRHYLVVRREGTMIYVLRLEHDDAKVLEIDSASFDEHAAQNDLQLTRVCKR